MQLERDFPEYVPDPEEAPVKPDVAPVQQEGSVREAYMEGLKSLLEDTYELAGQHFFAEALKKLDSAGDIIGKLARLCPEDGEGENVR